MTLFRLFIKLSVVMVAIALLFVAPAAQASTFLGKNGSIAFVKTVQGTANIWIMNPNGGSERQLTYEGGHTPVWSPDGRTLAFIHANGRLYSMKADGSNQRPLTAASGYIESSPVWSVDGQRLAFVRTEQTAQQRNAIFTINRDGTSEENVSGWSAQGQGHRGPSWAPDGKRIVYEHFGADFGRLLIKNLHNGHVRQLTSITPGTTANASWSPSGKKILFNDSPTEIYTIWPDGTHRTVISDGDSYYASWSPDGAQIAFVEDLEGDSLSISQSDGSIVYMPVQKGDYTNIGWPVWSPNGSKLLFIMSDPENKPGIFKLNVKDGAQKRLATGNVGQLSWQAKHE